MKKSFLYFTITFLAFLPAHSQFRDLQHRAPSPGEITVTGPMVCAEPGRTYILVNDISSPRSTLFAGKNVTIDLNGYTLSYADGKYGHIRNSGFEEGLDGWDISGAPGAKLEETAKKHVFIGNYICSLEKGDELVSDYVYLPEPDRSYYAMCGITGRYYFDMKDIIRDEMRISIFVEDENGKEVICKTRYRDSLIFSCPLINRSPRLGGGFVFAHLTGLKAGNYRLRIRAETDCLVDEIDIRPATDVGIGIAGKAHAYGHYDHLYNNVHSAFFDYAADPSGRLADSLPQVSGEGTVTIKNGTIRNASVGILSWGIQSTAPGVKVIMDNVRIISSGINTVAADLEQATIINCYFDVSNPFIINRHGSEFYGVDLRGNEPSEVSNSEFRGGQGCLSIKGKNSSVHNNLFVNRQTVTNHYSIMAMGDGSMIFENIFRPETGSGIEIFRKKNISIFNNEFYITAAGPSCEYPDHLSTNAIRIADYGATPGAANGAFGNRVYNNKFFINGRSFTEHTGFTALATAVFYSASAGENEISGNQIKIDQADPGTNAEAYAFYVGNSRGGNLHDNRIVTNVTPLWIGCAYGNAEGTIISRNTIEASNDGYLFSHVKLGPDNIARDAEFRSNSFSGGQFLVEASGKPHSYKVSWTLRINSVRMRAKHGRKSIIITDRDGKEVFRGSLDETRTVVTELPEYSVNGNQRTDYSPYTVICGRKKVLVNLGKNTSVDL